MKHRVTVIFNTKRGNKYLYDDITGYIFPWDDIKESVLNAFLDDTVEIKKKALSNQHSEYMVDATFRYIGQWIKNYGAFIRESSDQDFNLSIPPQDMCFLLRNEITMQLILVLTDDCNMRCRYCAYSDLYPLN